eukprot:1007260-Amphidinium_carterae.1
MATSTQPVPRRSPGHRRRDKRCAPCTVRRRPEDETILRNRQYGGLGRAKRSRVRCKHGGVYPPQALARPSSCEALPLQSG